MPSLLSQIGTKISTKLADKVGLADSPIFTSDVEVPNLTVNGSTGISFTGSGSLDMSMTSGGINLNGGGIYDSSNQINIGGNGIYVTGSSEFSNNLSVSGDYLYLNGSSANIDVSNGPLNVNAGIAAQGDVTTGFNVQGNDVTATNNLTANNKLILDYSSPEIEAANGQLAIGSQGINVSGDSDFQNNVTVVGDLTVSGTTTQVNSTTVATADTIIELNKDGDQASNNVNDIGIHGTRGSSEQNIFLGFDEGEDAIVAKTYDDDAGTTDVSMASGVTELNFKIPGANLICEGSDALGSFADFEAAIDA